MVRRKWKIFNKTSYLEKIKQVDWEPLYKENNPELANSIFEEILTSILESEAPMSTFQKRTKYVKWLDPATRQLMLESDSAREKARLSKDKVDWEEFRGLRNKCTALQKKNKLKYLRKNYEEIEVEHDSGRLYSMTKNLLGWNGSAGPETFQVAGRTTSKQKELADIQSQYYTQKIIDIKDRIPKVRSDPLKYLKKAWNNWTDAGNTPLFKIKKVTEKEVISMVKNLKNSQAFGRDEIDAASVKMAGKFLIQPIMHIINSSLDKAVFPQKWKLSRIIPLLKSTDADKTKPSSFRPVSNLPLLSKLTERTVQLQLLDHMEQRNLICSDNHAYRRRTSTTTALMQIADLIATGAEENKITASMSIDQSAAFDSVEHEILMEKLTYYGLSVETLQWIQSYLENRSGYVVVGSAKSIIQSIKQGVPQGSVLGPLLYLIYVNEFPTITKDDICRNPCHVTDTGFLANSCQECGIITMFADDAEYTTTSNSRGQNQDKIEENFVRIIDFLNSNGLEVNQGKTSLTEFMSQQKRSKISGVPPELTATVFKDNRFQDDHVTDSIYCRILGGNLRNNLSWESHLNSGKRAVLPAFRRKLGALHSLRTSLTFKGKRQLVNGLLISKLSYIICLWGNTDASHINKAQIALNSAARFVLNAGKRTRQTELMSCCDWLDVRELTEYFSTIQLWKVLRWNVPAYMEEKFQFIEDSKVWTKSPRLKLTREAWRCQSVEKWNLLPEYLRTELNLKSFKLQLKRFIKERRRENMIEGEPD